jgi:hypothetical protein
MKNCRAIRNFMMIGKPEVVVINYNSFSRYDWIIWLLIIRSLWKDVSSAPISKEKDDEVLALIGDGSIDRSVLQDMGAWPIRISDFFRDFMVQRGTNQLQKSDSHSPEDESGWSLTKHLFEKIPKWWEGDRTWTCFFPKKRCTFLLLMYIVKSELS